jgi:hypothetical protein
MSTLKSLTKAELVTLVQERNATIEQLRMDLSIAKVAKPVAPQPPKAAYTKTFVKGGKTFARVCIGFNTFAIREVTA